MPVHGHAFTMVPTEDLNHTVAAYINAGLELFWNPDPHTALLGIDGKACVIVEQDPTERALGSGAVLLTEPISDLGQPGNPRWAVAPMSVPVGQYAARDLGGTVIRYLNLSSCDASIRPWFYDTESNWDTR